MKVSISLHPHQHFFFIAILVRLFLQVGSEVSFQLCKGLLHIFSGSVVKCAYVYNFYINGFILLFYQNHISSLYTVVTLDLKSVLPDTSISYPSSL